VPQERIHFVGNVMIDTLLSHRELAAQKDILSRLGISSGQPYALVTLHRPSNVDDPDRLGPLLRALGELACDLDVVFPIHPRTHNSAMAAGLQPLLARLRVTEPLGYLDFLQLMGNARVVITDSGGIQEETTVLGVPCLTLRENTERPATIECGTNRLIGTDPQAMLAAARQIATGYKSSGRLPELWDGHAAERVVQVLKTKLSTCWVDGRQV